MDQHGNIVEITFHFNYDDLFTWHMDYAGARTNDEEFKMRVQSLIGDIIRGMSPDELRRSIKTVIGDHVVPQQRYQYETYWDVGPGYQDMIYHDQHVDARQDPGPHGDGAVHNDGFGLTFEEWDRQRRITQEAETVNTTYNDHVDYEELLRTNPEAIRPGDMQWLRRTRPELFLNGENANEQEGA